MVITAALLSSVAKCPIDRVRAYVAPLNSAMAEFDITTPYRRAAFIAEAAYESEWFSVVEENLRYSAAALLRAFPSHFTPGDVPHYADFPERIANRVYANRMGNGNEASGDGWRYRGRGLLQITGRGEYAACGVNLGLPLVADPDLLLQPGNAARSAAWYWWSNHLNTLADLGKFAAITLRINGGEGGEAERADCWHRALQACGVSGVQRLMDGSA